MVVCLRNQPPHANPTGRMRVLKAQSPSLRETFVSELSVIHPVCGVSTAMRPILSTDYESGGWKFESFRARHFLPAKLGT
ncbi:hypothetical protein MCP1_240029 [Candidatus Terasakiella magnetica]|nr:hypothetical protein MCP1_240029 [Candidatus Terasakiella magnetica]